MFALALAETENYADGILDTLHEQYRKLETKFHAGDKYMCRYFENIHATFNADWKITFCYIRCNNW